MSRTTETYEGFRKSEAWASLVLQGTLWSRVGCGTKRNSKRAGKSLGPGSWGTWEKENREKLVDVILNSPWSWVDSLAASTTSLAAGLTSDIECVPEMNPNTLQYY